MHLHHSVIIGSESASHDMCVCVHVCVSPTEDFFHGLSICVLVNPHCVTHTPGIPGVVCLFENRLAHSIPNPKALRERGSRINLCTYSTWETNVSIIYISPTAAPAAALHPSILHSHWHHSSFLINSGRLIDSTGCPDNRRDSADRKSL